MSSIKKRIKRRCSVCGKSFSIAVAHTGKYSPGYFFGDLAIPIEGTGEWKKVGKFKLGKRQGNTVKWTGKTKKVEYWECNACYDEGEKEFD